MAGGMGRGGRGPTLAERSAAAGAAGAATGPGAAAGPDGSAGPEPVDPAAGTAAAAARTRPRHCWVVDPPEAPGRWPGLLAEWRRAPDGLWEGRVVYAVTTAGHRVLVEAWLGVHRLEPE